MDGQIGCKGPGRLVCSVSLSNSRFPKARLDALVIHACCTSFGYEIEIEGAGKAVFLSLVCFPKKGMND